MRLAKARQSVVFGGASGTGPSAAGQTMWRCWVLFHAEHQKAAQAARDSMSIPILWRMMLSERNKETL